MRDCCFNVDGRKKRCHRFQRIDDLINRMGSITRQLKSYARKSEEDCEIVDIRASVREALSMMAPQLGKMSVDISTTLPSEPVLVLADPVRLEQIIVNLLRNALDAVSSVDQPEINILLVEGEMVLLSIEDNGVGLQNPGNCSSRSTPRRSREKAWDLGLAISAGLQTKWEGGWWRAIDRMEVLCLSFSCPARMLGPRPRSDAMEDAMNHKVNSVAIIDDEADMRTSVAQWLALSEFEAITFETAESALKALGGGLPRNCCQRHQDAGMTA